MIDPYNITKFDRSIIELEEFWIFSLSVAGKTAKMMAPKVHSFLYESNYTRNTPFKTIKNMLSNNVLRQEMLRVKLGKYQLLENAFLESINLNLKTASVEELEKVPGCGPKTARFFILHSRENQTDIAVLDVHILNYLRELGYSIKDGHPSKEEYKIYEEYFLQEAEKSDMSVADFDLMIWNSRAR